MPLAVIALPAGLALFWGSAAAVARLAWPEGWPRVLVFASAFAGAEWLRGHLFTGFPWNAFGYALTPAPIMMQSAAIVGLWGLTLAALIIFAAPAVLADVARRTDRGRAIFLIGRGGPAPRPCRLSARCGFPVASEGFVPGRAASASCSRRSTRTRNGWKRMPTPSSSAISSSATARPHRRGAVPAALPSSSGRSRRCRFFLSRAPGRAGSIAALLPPGTTLLITGAARTSRLPATRRRGVFNSVLVIGDDGEILDVYDKVHLVPFGEFLPFQGFLERLGIRQMTELPGGFLGRAAAAHADARRRAALRAADLLRDHLSRRRRRAGQSARVAPQRHQRCLVRRHARTAPAFSAGARARRRGGPAAGARRQLGHLGDRRCLWPGARELGVGQSGVDRRRSADGAFADRLTSALAIGSSGDARAGRVQRARARFIRDSAAIDVHHFA